MIGQRPGVAVTDGWDRRRHAGRQTMLTDN